MSFHFSLDPDAPLSLNIFTGNDETIIRTAIGHDDETGYVYSIVVGLSPYLGEPGNTYELIFNITEACSVTNRDIYVWWDGVLTKPKLNDKDTRNQTMAAILACVQKAIDVCKPNIVHMCTHTDGLPEKALQKFHQIALVFRHNGYDARATDPYHRRHMWIMKR